MRDFCRRCLLLVAVLFIVAGSSSAAQTEKKQNKTLSVPITDMSGARSPINASGRVGFVERLAPDSAKTRWSMTLRLTNTSGNTIVAYEFEVQAMPDHGMGVNEVYQADSFFRPDSDFPPGAQKTVTVSYPGWELSPPEKPGTRPRKASADFRVLFVQFADGSKFGGSNWAASLSDARQQAMQGMRETLAAYATLGNEGLRNSLVKSATRYSDPHIPRMTTSYMGYVRATLDSQGPGAAIAQIQDFLAVAQQRRDIR